MHDTKENEEESAIKVSDKVDMIDALAGEVYCERGQWELFKDI